MCIHLYEFGEEKTLQSYQKEAFEIAQRPEPIYHNCFLKPQQIDQCLL